MDRALSTGDPQPRRLLAFLLLSLLLHALLLAWFGPSRLATDAGPAPIVVSLANSPMPKPAQAKTRQQVPKKAQIVSPSDRDNDQAPTGRAFLSDRDNKVDQESLRRGNPQAGRPNSPADTEPVNPRPASERANVPAPAAPPAPAPAPARPAEPRQAAAPKSPPAKPAAAKPAPASKPAAAAKPPPVEARPNSRPQPRELAAREGQNAGAATREQVRQAIAAQARELAAMQAQRRALPGRDALLAPADQVLGRARGSSGSQAPSGDDQVAANDPHRDLLSAPPPARGMFQGLRGNFDDLPDVAAGSLTMLNTKADRFAPFVRRVGTRVFQNMLIYQRRDLEAPEILAASDLVTVKALLDSKGRLKDLSVVDRSGSLAVDQTLLDALREAAFDRNPPAEAANANGDFEFIFQAQLLASVQPGPGGPQIREVESRLRVGLL